MASTPEVPIQVAPMNNNVTVPDQSNGQAEDNNPVPNQNLLWGAHTEEDLTQIVNSAYEEVVAYQKNLFKLPSGAAGKRCLKEMTRLIETWVEDKQPLSKISLKMVMIMPALLMQKPCRKSTAKQHSEYLNSRFL